MAIFSVLVRDYHWSKHNYRVQSPNLDLRSSASNFIIRPLQGNNKDEPRIVETISDLRDDIEGDTYEAEAHGVFISATAEADCFPIWVPVQSKNINKKDHETYVVNLKTLEGLTVPVAQICWIPNREAPNGNLYTVIGIPRKMGHEETVMVLLQRPGFPNQTRFELMNPSVLNKYDRVDEPRKQQLVNWLLTNMSGKHNFQEPLMGLVSQIVLSPDRLDDGRRPSRAVLDENVDMLRCIARWLGGDFLDAEFDNHNTTTYDEPLTNRVEAPSQPYACHCIYPDLGPTILNSYPPHRHVDDDECPHGSTHANHCIFGLHRPNHCVIPSSGESHEHCPHLDPSNLSSSYYTPPQDQTATGTSSATETTIYTNTPDTRNSEMDTLESELESLGGGSISSEVDRLCRTGNADMFDTTDLDETRFNSLLDTPQSSPGYSGELSFLGMDTEMMGQDDRTESDVDYGAIAGPHWQMDRRAFRTPELSGIEF